jgi:hypothetical protein
VADKDKPSITPDTRSGALEQAARPSPQQSALQEAAKRVSRISRAPPPPPSISEGSSGSRPDASAPLASVRESIQRAARISDDRDAVRDNLPLVPPPPPTPPRNDPPSVQPMHHRDRRLYVILAWTAIPAALVVGCFIAWGSGQLPGIWALAGALVGIIGMAIGTVYALEKKTPFPRSPGPIIIGVALLTWALVGWQAWLAFHQQPPAAAQPVAALCSDGPCAPVHLKPGPKYFKGIALGVGGPEPLTFLGTTVATGERLLVAVDYSEYRSGWMEKQRAFIGEIKEPLKGKREQLQLIYYAVRENVGSNKLWWGDPSQNHPLSTSTYGDLLPAVLVRGRVAIIGSKGEQHYTSLQRD